MYVQYLYVNILYPFIYLYIFILQLHLSVFFLGLGCLGFFLNLVRVHCICGEDETVNRRGCKCLKKSGVNSSHGLRLQTAGPETCGCSLRLHLYS